MRTLQRPSRRARRQRLLQEWLENNGNGRAWADDLRAGEDLMEETITEEERECAADLMWAERAFKSGKHFQDRPRRRDSGWERDEVILPS